MINIVSIKKIANLVLVTAGFVILPISVLAAPVLTIQSTPVLSGTNGIDYNIVVTNTGDQVATDVFIRNTLALNQTFLSSILSPSISSDSNSRMVLTWYTPSIDPGATYTINLDTVVSGSFPLGTTIVNNHEVEGINFPTQTGTTTIQTGPITIAIVTPTPTPGLTPTPTPGLTPTPTPALTPTPTPTYTPTPTTLPVTGVDPLILSLILIAGLVTATLVTKRSLKNS